MSIIPNTTRLKLFEQARDCHPTLGAIVQNEMDITMPMLAQELKLIENIRRYLGDYAESLIDAAVKDV